MKKKIARVALVVILLLFGAAALMSVAHADEGFQWKHFGTDPYAATRAEAMRTRESAFRSMGLPAPVIAKFMRVTEKPGEKVRIVNGDKFSAMMSRNGVVHRDVTVAFVAPPVSGKMEYAAPAEQWQVVWEGKVFTVLLPEICNNWSYKWAGRDIALACASVEFFVKPGDEVRFAVLSRNRLPASACWQLCDGDDCSMFPSPCDTCDWVGPLSVIPTGFMPLHTGKYVARAEHQVLRFPREVMSNYIALCDERKGLGQSDSWVVQPSAWQDRMVVQVPYGGQKWPAWGEVDLSKWKR